jgi:hypothetical protein
MGKKNTGSTRATSVTSEKQPSKLQAFLEKNFSNIFSKEHWIYTITFAVVVGFLGLTTIWGKTLLDTDLFIAVAMMGGCFLLFVFCNRKPLKQYIIDGSVGVRAAMLGIFAAIFLVIAIVWYELTKKLVEKYQFTYMLPFIFMIIYLGWNFAQIFFLRKVMENISDFVQVKVFTRKPAPADKLSASKAYLIVAIVVPFVVLIAFMVYIFMRNSGQYVSQLWNEPTGIGSIVLVAWVIGMCIVFALGAFNIFMLHKQTIRHDTPSVAGPFLHMLFWIYIAYRAFGFITATSNIFTPIGSKPPSDFVDPAINVVLFIITIILVFEGIGATQRRSSLLTKENVPFVAYIIVTAAVMGIVSMTATIAAVTASNNASTLPAVMSAINNILMMGIAIVFYFSYVKRKLAQENYLERDNYSLHEIQGMFQEFATTMVSHHPNLNSRDVTQELTAFLNSKDMALSVAPKPAMDAAPVAAPEKAKKPKPEKVKESKAEKVKKAEPAPAKASPPPSKAQAKPAPPPAKPEEEPEVKDEEEAPAKDEEEAPAKLEEEAPAKDEEEAPAMPEAEAPAKNEEEPSPDDAPSDEEQ